MTMIVMKRLLTARNRCVDHLDEERLVLAFWRLDDLKRSMRAISNAAV
jgi:hypothetical protein